MGPQCVVIGLGAFGTAITRELARHSRDVMAIDIDMARVDRVKDEVAYAIRCDATDPKVLEAQDVHKMDVVIVALGHHFEASILITVELLQRNVKRLMVRAENELQRTALHRLGVHEILFPEEEVAKHVVQRVLHPGIVDLLHLSDDYSVVEVLAPEHFYGKTLLQLKLRERFNCNIVAIKRMQNHAIDTGAPSYRVIILKPEEPLEEGDVLIVFGLETDIRRMTE